MNPPTTAASDVLLTDRAASSNPVCEAALRSVTACPPHEGRRRGGLTAHQRGVGGAWSDRVVEHTTSADGTRIAFEELGSGRPIILTAGALSTAASLRPLAASFANAGWRGICWDRRGRGGSGDTEPYAPEREVEDLRAVIDAVAGDAVVFGHSGGAVLALLAAGSGVPMTDLFISEPVLRFGENEPPADLADRLQALVDDGQPEEAVLTFQRENVCLSERQLKQLQDSTDFALMVDLAQTTVYDTKLIASVSTPTPAMLHSGVPSTILRGEPGRADLRYRLPAARHDGAGRSTCRRTRIAQPRPRSDGHRPRDAQALALKVGALATQVFR